MKQVLAAAMAFALAGCSSVFANPTSIARLDIQQRQNADTSATIILSAGVRKTCLTSNPVMVDLVSRDTGKVVHHLTANNEFVKPQLEENHGFLHAVNVAPGRYYLTLDVWATQLVATPYAFVTLAPGDLVYLGEFFIDSSCAGTGKADTVLIRDQSARDLAVAAKLNPALDPAQVEVRVLSFDGQIDLRPVR